MFEKWKTKDIVQALKEAEDELGEMRIEEQKRRRDIAEIARLIDILKHEYDSRNEKH